MPQVDLNPQLADRMLSGSVAIGDVPAGLWNVQWLIDCAASDVESIEPSACRTAASMAAVVGRQRTTLPSLGETRQLSRFPRRGLEV